MFIALLLPYVMSSLLSCNATCIGLKLHNCKTSGTRICQHLFWQLHIFRPVSCFVGRDSVVAQHRPPDLQVENRLMNREELDRDLERRLNMQFTLEKKPYDLNKLKAAFQAKDKSKTGHLKRVEVRMQCTSIPSFFELLRKCIYNCS